MLIPLPPPRTSWVKAGLGKATLKSAIGAALAIGVLGAGQAQALVVTVNGQQWNVTTFTGSYDANISKFNTPANGGVMPWWTGNSNQSPASDFAQAVQFDLGTFSSNPPFGTSFQPGGPYFASTVLVNGIGSGSDSIEVAWYAARTGQSPIVQFSQTTLSRTLSVTYAQASLVPVPGPLPLFGAAAAFGFSRKLRKRINDSKAVGSSFPAA